MAEVTSRLEDYLEALFQLETSGQKLTVTALAENLKLTKGTITTVIKKMTEQGLVQHEAYGLIRLTDEGRKIGWHIFMKHERLTSFFHDFLGEKPEKSEEIACLIEHHLDGRAANCFFNLIDYLSDARASKQAWMDDLFEALKKSGRRAAPLTLADAGDGIVCRLTGGGKANEALADMGIVCGKKLSKTAYDSGQDIYRFIMDGREIMLEPSLAATVWVQ